MKALEISHLEKSFGGVNAVADLSFSVKNLKPLESLGQTGLERRRFSI